MSRAYLNHPDTIVKHALFLFSLAGSDSRDLFCCLPLNQSGLFWLFRFRQKECRARRNILWDCRESRRINCPFLPVRSWSGRRDHYGQGHSPDDEANLMPGYVGKIPVIEEYHFLHTSESSFPQSNQIHMDRASAWLIFPRSLQHCTIIHHCYWSKPVLFVKVCHRRKKPHQNMGIK